ncbi:phytanoyl-CoA dioxygenase family protein [Sulfitobacter sabulilitoris]|uniref:Phytanoyl-CoA dioxygenase n=1 Tax=Sulfitobacter sabulilitoris TaxID=2562655 RepID=A0A5S3PLW5_9RHOB|nr:phytanoyl-CoA dioxygenase family protein [Sulfitobacter sabulilitoris]TMM55341.1 phytanoyl-CoA dioxygenase [Sulfitobacter sabulilitoris]
MPHPLITQRHIDDFARDGAVLVKGLFADHVDSLRDGVAQNMASPGPYAAENLEPGAAGRFFDDYCNWQRIPAFEQAIRTSPAAEVAADLMQSETTQLFHDHVLVKEPGTAKPTPWHQDGPYYFVEGRQTVSFWSPLDPVTDASLRCVAGSHLWPRPVLPTRWLSQTSFYPETDAYIPVPDPDAEGLRVLEWAMQPGDAVAFHFAVLHGARGNATAARRRAFSVRMVGDDARYTRRPGPTSPPFPGHDMVQGQRLRDDWFPTIYRRDTADPVR